MSRIDKGGTKFKPMMPRTQKDRISEKPRSSTAPRSRTIDPTVQPMPSGLGPSSAETTEKVVSSAVGSTSTFNQPSQTAGAFLQVDNITTAQAESSSEIASTSESREETGNQVPIPAIGRHVGNMLPMPSRSGVRGNAISMPAGSRVVPAANQALEFAPSAPKSRAPNRPTTPIQLAGPVTPPAPESFVTAPTPEQPASSMPVQRKSRKRKQPDDSQPPELGQEQVPTEMEPAAKKRRQNKSAGKLQAPKPPPKGKGTRKSSRIAGNRDGNNSQENQEEVVHEASADEGNDENSPRPARRHRKSRPRVDKPVTAVPDEVVVLDETTMTMKDLCNGMGKGRVSGRYLETFIESNEATKRKRIENLRVKELTRRKELGLPIDDDEAQTMSTRGRRPSALTQDPLQTIGSGNDPALQVEGRDDEEEEEEDEYAGVAVTTRAPKVRYDANGNLVLDETELQFDRQAEADEELAAKGPMEVIVETDRGKFTNHASYSKKPRVERWSKEETELFYMGLRMFHTGFELIARTLPNRNRTMVRNKFKAEDRKNPEKITHYLSSSMRLPYDLDFLSRETGRDFSGPIPQVQAPALIEPAENAEDTEKDDESVKLRMSTAPPSGGESERGEGTSVNAGTSGRGRSSTKTKGRRKSSKSSNTSRPPSVPPRSASVATLNGESLPGISNAIERDKDSGPRPPRIAIANVSQRSLNAGSGVQMGRTTLSIAGGRNMLVLPGGGREFRRDD